MRSIKPTFISILAIGLLAGYAVGVAAQSEEDAASRPPVPSVGCGVADAEPGVHRMPPIDVDGQERQWVQFVPEASDGATPLPLWLHLHGKGEAAYSQVQVLKRDADEHGVVLAAADAAFDMAGWALREDDVEVDMSRSNPDIALTHAIIDHVSEQLCIDLARVYATGYSFGGEGVSVLACALEDRIAAVAPVAGMLDLGDTCVLDRPVPFIAIHGRADDHALFGGGWGGGLASANDLPVRQAFAQASIPERVANVAQRNGCEPEPTTQAIGEDVERWVWTCPDGAGVELIAHGGGHGWPMDERMPTNERIREFFEQHPMPE